MSESRAIFLSYAREDAGAARRIADALRSSGLEVWFDESELRGGDAWDAKIRRQIDEAALFMPIISQHTQERSKGYFRLEWKLAVDQTHLLAAGIPFVTPVVVDATKESEAVVPPEFMRVQWTRLPDALPTPGFVDQVKRLLERKGGAGSHEGTRSPMAHTNQAASAPSKKLPGWLMPSAVGLVVAAGVFLLMRKPDSAEPKPTVAAPATAPATPKPVAPVNDKSIAVLPFANMSEDKEASAFFSDGIHEDILTNLALVRELRVVSRTSVMGYRGTTKPMKQIAQELGVTYILEGSVRRVGNKVRVTGQLIHAASDEHVWAQTYDRDLTDVFAIQSELSRQIAGALKTALSPEEKIMIELKPTTNSEAYDAYLRARDINNRLFGSLENVNLRIKLLRRAVELDPEFGRAWGELASVCANAYFWNLEGMEQNLAEAKKAIDRAVQLAPDDPDVIASLGTYYYYALRDYTRATEQYERLARLQPNSPVVFNSLGLIYRRQGRWAESLARQKRAVELDPSNLSYLRNLHVSELAVNRWDDAIASQRRISALSPGDLWEEEVIWEYHWFKSGSRKEMEAYLAGWTPAQRDSPAGIAIRSGWATVIGDSAEVVRLDKLQPYYEEDGDPHWFQASIVAIHYLAIGDRKGAIERLGDLPAQVRSELEREPLNKRLWHALARMEVVLGNKEAALRAADRMCELLPESIDAVDGVLYASYRARIYDWVGEKDKALAEYTRLLRKPNGNLFVKALVLKSGYSTLRGDPRFEALVNDPKNNAPLF